MKIQKLAEFVDPVKAQWQSEPIRTSLKSYEDFCQFLGLDKAQKYLASKRAHEISDWGSYELDSEGMSLQQELEERLKVRSIQVKNSWITHIDLETKTLPLRPTKSFLAFSVERLDKSSPAFQASYALWQQGFANILADLLQYLKSVLPKLPRPLTTNNALGLHMLHTIPLAG
jgi:exportin-5